MMIIILRFCAGERKHSRTRVAVWQASEAFAAAPWLAACSRFVLGLGRLQLRVPVMCYCMIWYHVIQYPIFLLVISILLSLRITVTQTSPSSVSLSLLPRPSLPSDCRHPDKLPVRRKQNGNASESSYLTNSPLCYCYRLCSLLNLSCVCRCAWRMDMRKGRRAVAPVCLSACIRCVLYIYIYIYI